MKKKMVLVVILGMILGGCSAMSTQSTTDPDTKAKEETASQEVQKEEGLAWPAEYMGKLPIPKSAISDIQRLNGTEYLDENDKSTKPTSVNVIMNEMTKEDALDYYKQLKEAGLQILSDEKDDEVILLVGVFPDDNKNPMLFRYEFQYNLGNVSRNLVAP